MVALDSVARALLPKLKPASLTLTARVVVSVLLKRSPVSATGFAQAFQNQRGDAFARDEDEEEDDDDIDELGEETPVMSGALNGNSHPLLPSPIHPIHSKAGTGLSFLDSEGITPSDDDLAASLGNTSKSFGMNHEGGMLNPKKRQELRSFIPRRLRVDAVGAEDGESHNPGP